MIANKKGFTLIELIIVIAILAILVGVVVLVLNPAELLRQARDSKRMSDLGGLTTALNLYLADVASPDLCSRAAYPGNGCATTAIDSGICTATTTLNIFSDATGLASAACGLTNASTTVDGTGWVDVNLGSISGGSPISILPLDPTNVSPNLYAYKATTSPNLSYELDTRLESAKYRGLMATDGGDRNSCSTYVEATCWYETGSFPGLSL